MLLNDFLKAIFASGEEAMQAARIEYAENIGVLAGDDVDDVEGKVSGLSAAPLDAFMPKKMTLKVGVRFFERYDGRIGVELDGDKRTQRRGIGRRLNAKRGEGEVIVKWSATAPPEGICRVRDQRDNEISDELRKLR